MAVIARAIPRRRHDGSVLTKITLAVIPNAAEPDVPRTTPSGSRATHSANWRGSDRKWLANARGSGMSGSARSAAAPRAARVCQRPPAVLVIGEPVDRPQCQLWRQSGCVDLLQVVTGHRGRGARPPPAAALQEDGTLLRECAH